MDPAAKTIQLAWRASRKKAAEPTPELPVITLPPPPAMLPLPPPLMPQGISASAPTSPRVSTTAVIAPPPLPWSSLAPVALPAPSPPIEQRGCASPHPHPLPLHRLRHTVSILEPRNEAVAVAADYSSDESDPPSPDHHQHSLVLEPFSEPPVRPPPPPPQRLAPSGSWKPMHSAPFPSPPTPPPPPPPQANHLTPSIVSVPQPMLRDRQRWTQLFRLDGEDSSGGGSGGGASVPERPTALFRVAPWLPAPPRPKSNNNVVGEGSRSMSGKATAARGEEAGPAGCPGSPTGPRCLLQLQPPPSPPRLKSQGGGGGAPVLGALRSTVSPAADAFKHHPGRSLALSGVKDPSLGVYW